MNCGPDWDNETARSPQTGGPLASMSRDLGVIRRLSNLHIEKNKNCQIFLYQQAFVQALVVKLQPKIYKKTAIMSNKYLPLPF